ncbi:hypothetical protein CO178_00895 [candidate division WWE3 bacterium CG_4_9_14_3_um_filter_34_6]|uniref:DUF3800 domain-containing protein n=1 Tax=candidate division WWE3 bacterium CG_4_9_14_3_um_filter_34_6 TaxID=1975079 RepID=A0A2M7X4N5_UNCKA|nr:MAG: hypothetical protein CO178_00895 [candidate division WWE3 bacterium CG_4_9_14_3_um_filter_34_6]
MSYIFMDESGDLGFSFDKGSSNYFIITFVFVNNPKPIRNIIKNTFKTLKKSHKSKTGVLHAYNETLTTKRRVLLKLSQSNIKIMCIYLNKHKVFTHLKEEKNILYNYITNILLDRINTKELITLEDLNIIAERKDTNKFLTNNFKDYLEKQSRNNHGHKLNVTIKTPHQDKCLQATDFISWAIFRKYEKGDEYYYDLIKDKIFEENGLFK